MNSWIWAGAAVVVVGGTFVIYYNRFVTLLNRVDNSLAQIDVQLKKRADLVPNLVEIVKGYVKHEKSVFKEVTEARKALVSARNFDKKMKANSELQNVLKSLFAIAENYPQLKASDNFKELQMEMSAIEDKIAYSRQFYNDSIMTYNVMRQRFPGNLFAKMYGFGEKKYIEIKQEEKIVPKLSF